jgi:hypothetical protein
MFSELFGQSISREQPKAKISKEQYNQTNSSNNNIELESLQEAIKTQYEALKIMKNTLKRSGKNIIPNRNEIEQFISRTEKEIENKIKKYNNIFMKKT